MTRSLEAADGLTQGQLMASLGGRFWVMWWLGMIGIVAAFFGVMWLIFPYSGHMPWILVGGVVVIVFTCALIGMCMLPMRVLQKRGLESKMRLAYRKYMWRFLPAMFGYVFLLLGATFYMQQQKPEGIVAVLVALAPSLPVMLAIRAVILLPREETDEYLRDGIYRAYSLATGGTLAICTVWGFLDLFRIVPHVEMWAVFGIWAICLIPAQIICQRSKPL